MSDKTVDMGQRRRAEVAAQLAALILIKQEQEFHCAKGEHPALVPLRKDLGTKNMLSDDKQCLLTDLLPVVCKTA